MRSKTAGRGRPGSDTTPPVGAAAASSPGEESDLDPEEEFDTLDDLEGEDRSAASPPTWSDVRPSRRSRRRRDLEPEEDGPRPVIRTRGLTKTYGDRVAVDHLNLTVMPGEIFGLLGQNGAGKTTTILMLLGLTEPTEGQARVVGLDPARHPLEVKSRVGYLPDAVGFYGSMTGRENLRYTARLNGIPGDEADGRIDAVVGQVGMSDRADSLTETYSRGMLQRLGIADALLKGPEVLILDEPTTAIDPIGVGEILDLLRHLVDERGMAILLSSHLLGQVQSVCDRVGIFAEGKMIGLGTVPELGRQFGDGHAHLEVGFAGLAGPDPRVDALLGGITGVVDWSASPRLASLWAVRALAGESERVRAAIPPAATAVGLDLVTLREIEVSLDEIYKRAAAELAAAAPNGAAA